MGEDPQFSWHKQELTVINFSQYMQQNGRFHGFLYFFDIHDNFPKYYKILFFITGCSAQTWWKCCGIKTVTSLFFLEILKNHIRKKKIVSDFILYLFCTSKAKYYYLFFNFCQRQPLSWLPFCCCCCFLLPLLVLIIKSL